MRWFVQRVLGSSSANGLGTLLRQQDSIDTYPADEDPVTADVFQETVLVAAHPAEFVGVDQDESGSVTRPNIDCVNQRVELALPDEVIRCFVYKRWADNEQISVALCIAIAARERADQ